MVLSYFMLFFIIMFGNAYDERNQYGQFAFSSFLLLLSMKKDFCLPGVLRYGCRNIMDRREF